MEMESGVWLLHLVNLACWFDVTRAVASITKDPQSMTVPVGETATFQCAGIGDYVLWKINGQSYQESSAQDSQFVVTRETVPGLKLSNLTVLTASTENDGTTVQCVVITFSPPSSANSTNATLTVSPGIGNIRNLTFNDDTSTISWDPPQTAGVLGDLFYQLMVINNNTGVVLINTTTALTSHKLLFKPCQVYEGKVTPHVGSEVGKTVVKMHRTPTEYYELANESANTMVAIHNETHVAVFFTTNIIQRNLLRKACPGQVLTSVTYPKMNHSERTPHEGKVIEKTGVIEYTVYVEKKCHCTSDILIIADNREVEKKTTDFSTFDVQDCDVHTDHTSYILVECTFAINSTAPGIVLIKNEHGQHIHALEQDEGDDSKRSLNITDLSEREYIVTVYDDLGDIENNVSFAYKYVKSTSIVSLTVELTTFSHDGSSTSPVFPCQTCGNRIVKTSLTIASLSSTSNSFEIDDSHLIIIVGVIILAIVIIITITSLLSIYYFVMKTRQCHTAILCPGIYWPNREPINGPRFADNGTMANDVLLQMENIGELKPTDGASPPTDSKLSTSPQLHVDGVSQPADIKPSTSPPNGVSQPTDIKPSINPPHADGASLPIDIKPSTTPPDDASPPIDIKPSTTPPDGASQPTDINPSTSPPAVPADPSAFDESQFKQLI